MKDDARALTQLVTASRREHDPWAYLEAVIAGSELLPTDLLFFVEALAKVAGDRAESILKDRREVHCSFCLKSGHEVKGLVAAPNASICAECIEIARKNLPRTGILRSLFGPKRSERMPTSGERGQ